MEFEFATTVEVADLAKRLGKAAEDVEVAHAHATALALLEDATSTVFRPIPEPVCDDLVYRVGRAVYDGGKQQHGGGQLTQVQGETAVRAPRDPIAVAGPILARYVIGFA